LKTVTQPHDMPSNDLTLAGFLDGVLAHANWVNSEEGIDI